MLENAVLSTDDCLMTEEDIYFFANEINALCKLNCRDGNVTIISDIPGEQYFGVHLISAIMNVENDIILTPLLASKIWRYNMESGNWMSYNRKTIDFPRPHSGMAQIVPFENKIFVVGSFYPAIIVINTLNNKMEYIEGPYSYYNQLENAGKDIYFRRDHIVIGDTLYLPSCIDNSILKLDMSSYQFEIVKAGREGNAFSGIDFDGKNFFLSPRKGEMLTIWDGKNNYDEIFIGETKKDTSMVEYTGVIYWEGDIILPAYIGNRSVVVEKSGKVAAYEKEYYFMKKVNRDVRVSQDRREQWKSAGEQRGKNIASVFAGNICMNLSGKLVQGIV